MNYVQDRIDMWLERAIRRRIEAITPDDITDLELRFMDAAQQQKGMGIFFDLSAINRVYYRWDNEMTQKQDIARKRAKRREEAQVKPDIACVACGEMFQPKRSTARYCSTKCRVAAHRAEGKQ